MPLNKESVLSLKKKQQHNLGLSTFTLPISTKHLLKYFVYIFICTSF